MNIIDQSPMKMTTQEALYSQCSRRMKEAKTDDEKAAIVQNYAEQLRLEKLRSKRLQENLRELNNAIDHLSLPSSIGDATTTTMDLQNGGGGNVKTTTTTTAAAACRFPTFDNSVPSARSVLTDGEPARPKETWMDPYSANFDLFSNRSSATKNVIGQLSANNSEPIKSVVMKRRLSDAGPVAFGESNNAAASVFNRPLNANAAPFVPSFGGQQSRIAAAAISAPLTRSSVAEQAAPRRRISDAPGTPAAAVAPKSLHPFDTSRNNISTAATTTASPQQQTNISTKARSRSASSGPHERQLDITNNPSNDWPVLLNGNGTNELISPPPPPSVRENTELAVAKLDGFPKSYFKRAPAADAGGSVKIDNSGTTSSLLKGEDWDSEYSQEHQQPRQEEPDQTVSDTMTKRNSNTRRSGRFPEPLSKDWVAILKEREDVAKRRYSREKMLELYASGASKIRPSHLSAEYNNEVGLWSPDLWFPHQFPPSSSTTNPRSQLAQQRNNNRSNYNNNNNNNRNIVSIGFGPSQQPPEAVGMRRISCLSAFRDDKKCEMESSRPLSR